MNLLASSPRKILTMKMWIKVNNFTKHDEIVQNITFISHFDIDANQSIVQKRTVKQKSRSKSTASRKRKLILDSVIELQSSHMKANLSNQKDLLRQVEKKS